MDFSRNRIEGRKSTNNCAVSEWSEYFFIKNPDTLLNSYMIMSSWASPQRRAQKEARDWGKYTGNLPPIYDTNIGFFLFKA